MNEMYDFISKCLRQGRSENRLELIYYTLPLTHTPYTMEINHTENYS